MMFYIFLLFIVFIILLACNEKNSKYKILSLAIVSLIFTIVIGLRNIDLGLRDTKLVYVPEFYKLIHFNFNQIFEEFKDPMFYVLTKVYTLISENVQIWLILCALCYIIPIMLLIYKESRIPIISVFTFIALNYFGIAFSGIRHCIACGIICFSYKSLKEKNLVKFTLNVIFASLFHITSLIMMVAYPIYCFMEKFDKKMFKKTLTIIIIVFFVNNLFGRNIIAFLFDIIINTFNLTRFSIYTQENFSSLNNNVFYIHILIYIFAGIMFFSKNDEIDEKRKTLLILQFIGTLLTAFVSTLGEFYRLSMFFTIFSIILIPEAVNLFKNADTKKYGTLLIIVFMSAYFVLFSAENNGIMPYKTYFS